MVFVSFPSSLPFSPSRHGFPPLLALSRSKSVLINLLPVTRQSSQTARVHTSTAQHKSFLPASVTGSEMAMDRRTRRVEEERPTHGRFLRPGALARLRDSRIVARSLRSAAARLLLPSAPLSPAPAAEQQRQDGVPHFLAGPARGLCGVGRYPLRRRMAAARCVVFLPPPEAFLEPSWDLAAARWQ